MNKQEEYFKQDFISNSKLRNFVSYNKYEQRLYTPDKYIAFHIDKSIKFKLTDAIIIWKIVDIYFDWTGKKVWEKYIPVAKRTWKAIKELIETRVNKYIQEEGNPITDDINKEEIEELQEKFSKEIEKEWVMEITMKMRDEAEEMIAWWKAFRQFKEFLKDEDTEAQVQLKETINWVTMKGLPDFVNKKKNLIVDLKTTWSMDMIIDQLQFRWTPKLTANYIRQLSIYNKLLWGWYDWALALVTSTGVKWISIPNAILEEAWTKIEEDIISLNKFLENPKTLEESIFVADDSMIPLDELTI